MLSDNGRSDYGLKAVTEVLQHEPITSTRQNATVDWCDVRVFAHSAPWADRHATCHLAWDIVCFFTQCTKSLVGTV